MYNEYLTRLKGYRKERKLTQFEAAELIGMSRSQYSDIENGRYHPNLKTIESINKIFEIVYIK